MFLERRGTLTFNPSQIYVQQQLLLRLLMSFRVMEGRLLLIVEPLIQEGQWGLNLGVDQILTLVEFPLGSWEFGSSVYLCFVDLEVSDLVP